MGCLREGASRAQYHCTLTYPPLPSPNLKSGAAAFLPFPRLSSALVGTKERQGSRPPITVRLPDPASTIAKLKAVGAPRRFSGTGSVPAQIQDRHPCSARCCSRARRAARHSLPLSKMDGITKLGEHLKALLAPVPPTDAVPDLTRLRTLCDSGSRAVC